MKRIITIMLSILIIVMTSSVVSAENRPYYQATRVTYEVPGSFTAMIPMEINAGEPVAISVDDVNIAENKQIIASICYLDENDELRLTMLGESGYIPVRVFDQNGTQYTRGNNFVGQFTSNGQKYTVNTEVQNIDGLKAGVYTGNMSFEFEIIDV